MLEFLIRRSIQGVIVLFVVSVLVFSGVYLIGNPVDILISATADQAERQQIISEMGLDRPMYVQYLLYMERIISGDFGQSFVHNRPALELIFERMPATLELAFFAMVTAIVVGIPLGLYAGSKEDSWLAKAVMGFSILGFSVPTFWIGIMLMLLFSVVLNWLPVAGRGEPGRFLGIESAYFSADGWRHILLPGITLALYKVGIVIRVTRSGVRDLMHSEMVRFARAKGVSMGRIMRVHVLRNLLVQIITVIGLELGSVIAFAVVVETIFSWPGMGKLVIDSIMTLDRPVIVSYILMITLMFLLINLIVDVLYTIVDPRIRLQGN